MNTYYKTEPTCWHTRWTCRREDISARQNYRPWGLFTSWVGAPRTSKARGAAYPGAQKVNSKLQTSKGRVKWKIERKLSLCKLKTWRQRGDLVISFSQGDSVTLVTSGRAAISSPAGLWGRGRGKNRWWQRSYTAQPLSSKRLARAFAFTKCELVSVWQMHRHHTGWQPRLVRLWFD